MRLSTFFSASALLAAVAFPATAVADEKETWRLFVADHTEAVVHAIDTATGEKIDSFALKSPASLYVSESGRTVFAVQRDGNLASAIASGISVDDHGDHGDLEVSAPKLLDATVAGERPVHFVDHHGNIAIFFDGEGVARFLSERDLIEGQPRIRGVTTEAPHHGVAISYGEHVVVSFPNRADPTKNPDGVKVLDAAANQVGPEMECPGLHGEASSGNVLAIACDSGLLLVKATSGAPEIGHLAYTENLPKDARVSTLLGGKGLQYFLGNFGPSAVVLIDPQDEEAFRHIELPMRRVHFAADPVRAKFAYVFTEDGNLHQINVLSGRIAKSIRLTEPYSMDGHWSEPRPRIAVAGDETFVTDPLKGVIHAIGAEKFEKSREIVTAGRPFNIVAVGGSGSVHD
jgi:hypothetical protein